MGGGAQNNALGARRLKSMLTAHFFLGFTMSRQSKSPRRRPCMSTSAVAALVAMGIRYWSQSRASLSTLSKPSGFAGSQK